MAEAFLNRPQAFNAFDLDMIRHFSDRLITLAADDAVRGIVISGEGKVFCAGQSRPDSFIGHLGHTCLRALQLNLPPPSKRQAKTVAARHNLSCPFAVKLESPFHNYL